MKIIRSTHVADAVLSIVCEIVEHSDLLEDENLYITPYQNGREHGWHISRGLVLGVSFSEDRRSDNIVVYAGKEINDFDINNIPSEPVYKNAKYFFYSKYYEAAEYIVKQLFEKEETNE